MRAFHDNARCLRRLLWSALERKGGVMGASDPLGWRERFVLVVIAAVGGLGLNGVFLYVVFVRRDLLDLALGDPVAWALMVEALMVTGLLAWVFARRAIGRLGALWFVVLSLAGGLAFS